MECTSCNSIKRLNLIDNTHLYPVHCLVLIYTEPFKFTLQNATVERAATDEGEENEDGDDESYSESF